MIQYFGIFGLLARISLFSDFSLYILLVNCIHTIVFHRKKRWCCNQREKNIYRHMTQTFKSMLLMPGPRKKLSRIRCGECEPCSQSDCGLCKHCIRKVRNNGHTLESKHPGTNWNEKKNDHYQLQSNQPVPSNLVVNPFTQINRSNSVAMGMERKHAPFVDVRTWKNVLPHWNEKVMTMMKKMMMKLLMIPILVVVINAVVYGKVVMILKLMIRHRFFDSKKLSPLRRHYSHQNQLQRRQR